jgi:hypothetical protein
MRLKNNNALLPNDYSAQRRLWIDFSNAFGDLLSRRDGGE